MSSEDSSRVPVLLMVRELGIGGTERQLAETARFLQAGRRFLPHVGCFRPDGLRRGDLESAEIPILHLPVYSFKSPRIAVAARRLIEYIHQQKIQIVHSFDAPLNIFAVPVARLGRTTAVLSSQRGHRDLMGARLKRLLRLTDGMADAVVVNCEAMRKYLVEEEHVPERKVRLCYNGIDVERYQRRAVPLRFPGHLVVGTVCALRPEKGLDTLLRAFAGVRELGAKLVLVGSGPEEVSLRALSSRLGIAGDCHFEPTTKQVADWLSEIEIFVLPSRSEALSNALMEAMACACCPVASNVGGNPELIQHNRNGVLFSVDDVDGLASQLRQLVIDQDRRQHLAAEAAKTIRANFTFAEAASAMEGIYDAVLQSKQSPRAPG